MSIFANVAEISAERMEELAGQASLRDAGTTAGLATDKLLALTQDPQTQLNNHLHVHLESVNLIEQWNEMCSRLPKAKSVNGDAPTDASAQSERSSIKEG
jgi:hypothetical protein